MVSQLCLMCGSTLNCQTLCPGARPRYSLVVDEDVKKPTNQPTKIDIINNHHNSLRSLILLSFLFVLLLLFFYLHAPLRIVASVLSYALSNFSLFSSSRVSPKSFLSVSMHDNYHVSFRYTHPMTGHLRRRLLQLQLSI